MKMLKACGYGAGPDRNYRTKHAYATLMSIGSEAREIRRMGKVFSLLCVRDKYHLSLNNHSCHDTWQPHRHIETDGQHPDHTKAL